MTGRYRAPPAPRRQQGPDASAGPSPVAGPAAAPSDPVPRPSNRFADQHAPGYTAPGRLGPGHGTIHDRSPNARQRTTTQGLTKLPTGISSATTARTGFGCMAGGYCVRFWSGLHGNIASLRHCPLFSADRDTLESGAHDVDGILGCQRPGRRGAGVLCTVRLPYVLRPRTADDDPVDGPAGVADGLLNSIGATRRPSLPPVSPSVTASTKYVNRKSLTLSRNVLASSQRSDGSRPQYTSAVRWWRPWAIRS